MSYPRMNKDDYGNIPKSIENEEDYKLVLEYLVMASIKMEKIINDFKFPLQSSENKAKYKSQIMAMDKRYVELCNMIDKYREKGVYNE